MVGCCTRSATTPSPRAWRASACGRSCVVVYVISGVLAGDRRHRARGRHQDGHPERRGHVAAAVRGGRRHRRHVHLRRARRLRREHRRRAHPDRADEPADRAQGAGADPPDRVRRSSSWASRPPTPASRASHEPPVERAAPGPTRHLGLDLGVTNLKWAVVERARGHLDAASPTARCPRVRRRPRRRRGAAGPSRPGGHARASGDRVGRHRGARAVRPRRPARPSSWSTCPAAGAASRSAAPVGGRAGPADRRSSTMPAPSGWPSCAWVPVEASGR